MTYTMTFFSQYQGQENVRTENNLFSNSGKGRNERNAAMAEQYASTSKASMRHHLQGDEFKAGEDSLRKILKSRRFSSVHEYVSKHNSNSKQRKTDGLFEGHSETTRAGSSNLQPTTNQKNDKNMQVSVLIFFNM